MPVRLYNVVVGRHRITTRVVNPHLSQQISSLIVVNSVSAPLTLLSFSVVAVLMVVQLLMWDILAVYDVSSL